MYSDVQFGEKYELKERDLNLGRRGLKFEEEPVTFADSIVYLNYHVIRGISRKS